MRLIVQINFILFEQLNVFFFRKSYGFIFHIFLYKSAKKYSYLTGKFCTNVMFFSILSPATLIDSEVILLQFRNKVQLYVYPKENRIFNQNKLFLCNLK